MNDTLNILFEDESIIVIDKQRGLATQSAKSYEKDAVSLIKEHLRKENPSVKVEPYVGVVHRLDQPVSGILVFAKNQKAAAMLSKQAAGDVMNKHYMAIVEGILEDEKEVELVNNIYKDPKTKMAVITDDFLQKETVAGDFQPKKAVLTYRVVSVNRDENTTKLEISLKTGRFHQIRAQLTHLGHPIIGDKKYGSSYNFPGGIALTAFKLEFVHPISKKSMQYTVESDFV